MTLLLSAALLLSVNVSGDSAEPPVDDDALTAVGVPDVLSEPPYGIFDRLAQCESSGNWHANTGNGYFGGLQADRTFWARHGGLQYAARADLASRAQQIDVAKRGLAVQGPRAWPVCGPRVGLGAYR